jgi:hypothetical protein
MIEAAPIKPTQLIENSTPMQPGSLVEKIGVSITLPSIVTNKVIGLAQSILENVPTRFKGVGQKDSGSMDLLRLYGKRRGRGPCMGCLAETEENHHGGSQCRKRGEGGLGIKKRST